MEALLPDARSPDLFGIANVIRPGHRFGPKPSGPHIHRTPCSEVTAFCVCPQLHAFGYEMGLKAADEDPARATGTLVHAGLAYRYGALLPQKPEWMVYPDARTALWTIAQGNMEAGPVALKVFDAYQEFYPIERNYWRPMFVEHQMEIVVPVDGVPERYTLRLDLIAQDMRDGAVVLIDHKTTYKLSKWIGHNYATDREMLTALALARHAGIDIQRLVINAMTKGTKEHPQPMFERYDVPISADAYARIGSDTVHWIRQIRKMKAEYPDPTNRPRAYEQCMRKFGICDFAPICTHGPHRLAEFTKKW